MLSYNDTLTYMISAILSSKRTKFKCCVLGNLHRQRCKGKRSQNDSSYELKNILFGSFAFSIPSSKVCNSIQLSLKASSSFQS